MILFNLIPWQIFCKSGIIKWVNSYPNWKAVFVPCHSLKGRPRINWIKLLLNAWFAVSIVPKFVYYLQRFTKIILTLEIRIYLFICWFFLHLTTHLMTKNKTSVRVCYWHFLLWWINISVMNWINIG